MHQKLGIGRTINYPVKTTYYTFKFLDKSFGTSLNASIGIIYLTRWRFNGDSEMCYHKLFTKLAYSNIKHYTQYNFYLMD